MGLMVSIEEFRRDFGKRLRLAAKVRRMPELGLAAALARATGVTPKAAGKWLNGEAMPSHEKIAVLANFLTCEIQWLAFGDTPPGELIPTGWQSNVAPASQPPRYYRYPVLSEVAAGEWAEAIQPYEPGAEDHFENTDYQAKGPAFWLEVTGDSMTAPTSPSIPEGAFVLVDTGIEPKPGDLVVAKIDADDKATFKRLVSDAGQLYLKPLNSAYRMIPIDGNCRLIGVVKEAKLKL